MNTTVDFETARQLRDAGFPQPGYPIPNQSEVVGKLFYSPSGNKFLGCWQEENESIVLQPYLHNKESDGVINVVFAPTALEIIEQMPGRWLSRDRDGLWHVTWTVTQYYQDERIDACPHKAAAMAFIAWKKGKE